MRLLWRLTDLIRHKARLRRSDHRHAWGARGEDLAQRYIQKLGYIVVARNWRAEDGSGELDLVAWDGPALVVVEVKSRASIDFGLPEEAVDSAKRSALSRTAGRYLREADIPNTRLRFDIVSIVFDSEVRIDHIRGAFSRHI